MKKSLHFFNKLFCLFLFFSLIGVNELKAALAKGDIMVVGLSTVQFPTNSVSKEFAVLTLATIASGEVIYFTDIGITSGALHTSPASGEGVFSLTTTSTIVAGTLIKFILTTNTTTGVPTISSSPSIGTLSIFSGWNTTSGVGAFGNSGEQILIYQGTYGSPTFISGFNSSSVSPISNGWNTSTPDNIVNRSDLPPGLTAGVDAIGFASGTAKDNFVYSGTFSGTKAQLLTAINNISNWTTNDVSDSPTSNYDLTPGGTQFAGSNPIFTVTSANSAPTDLALSATSVNENVTANSQIGTFSTTDADAGNTFTYSFVAGGADNGSFTISGNSLTINSVPNFESKSSYAITIRTTDQGNLFFDKAFTITINNVNETPTDIPLSATSINENVAANSQIGTFSTTDADVGNTFTYTLVAGAGSTDNASFSISGTSLTINSIPNFETKSSYSVRVRTTDQGSLFFEKTFTITINNVNETPTDITLSATAINENVAANSQIGTFSTTDADVGNTFTYTLVAGAGSTDNASFSISGTSLTINSIPNFETKSSYSVRVRTTDQGSLFFEKTFTITINNVNETPTDIALSATAINENVAANSQIGTFSTTDVDVGNTFTYSFVAGGADNGSFTISGNSLTINSIPNFESKSSYAITIRTTDQGNLFFDKAFTITINNVNETPTDIALSATSINENVAANSTIGSLSTTDPDAGNTFTYTLVAGAGDTDNASFNISGGDLRITTSPNFEVKNSYTVRVRTTDQGSLTYEEAFTITINNVNETPTDISLSATSINENVTANSTIGSLSTTDPDAGNTFTYTLVAGAGDSDNASFNISGGDLRITSSPNFEVKNSYTVRVRTTDQGSLTYEEAFTITINNVNETPTDISLSATSINENVSANSTIGTLSTIDPDAGNTFTYTLVAGAGDTDNASLNISGGDLRITTSPNFEVKNSYTVRIRTTDQGSLNYEEAFTITINNVNETPTDIALSATSINENVSANSTIGTLSTTDPDAGNTFTYTLVAGAGDTDNASFNISGGDLRITNSPNFEVKNSYTVRVRTTDQGSLTYEEAFTITINNVNETPTDIALSATSINENVAANSTIGTFSTIDPDAGNTFTYSLAAGAGDTDNSSFNISGGDLRITTSPNFETKNSYTVRVRTTDQGSLTYEEAFTITINNVNEAPTNITLSATSINENVTANSQIGTFTSTDTDVGNTFTYSFAAGGTDNGSFTISGNSLTINSIPNFEVKSSYAITIRTTDQGNLFFDKAFTITINNVNETPTDIALSATSINENVASNTVVGTLSTTDPDAGNTFIYTLVAGAGDTDNASFNISGGDLRITTSPNFETKNSYTIRIRTTDQGSLTYEEAFTITINNVNETPTDIALSATSVNENVAANSTVGTLSTTDLDAGNTFTYSFVSGGMDNGSFSISGNSLTINSIPNFESKSSYAIIIRTTDQGNLFFDKAFTITINNINETPTDIALSATSVNENVAANSTVGTLNTTDPDVGNTFTYTLVAGAGDTDNSSFNISGGDIRITNSPNFEVKNSYTVRIRTTDQGSLTYEEAFTITINNVNETPTDIALSSTSVNENVATNSTVGTLSTTDPDAGNTFTYTLVAGAGDTDNASFNISGSSLRITNSPNFEVKNSYTVRVRITDQGSLTFEKSFTITINNVNENPTIANAIPNQNATENQAFNFQFATNTFTDVDAGTTLTYASQLNGGGALPAWLSFNTITRTFSGTPVNSNVGNISIDVIANDGSGGTATAIFNITVGATLPVTLNQYSAVLQKDGTVLLTWDTFSEQNNDYFELSRSTDGQNFAVISTIKGKGTTTQRNLYTYADRTPISGDNYYKLVQVDLDGTKVELGIRSALITLAKEAKVSVYPNPSIDVVNVVFESGFYKNAFLLDLSGKILFTKSLGIKEDNLSFNINELPSSTYIIKLDGLSGTITKLIVKK